MRVNSVISFQFSVKLVASTKLHVPNHKLQFTNHKFYPLVSSQRRRPVRGEEILEFPSFKSQIPRSKFQERKGMGEFGKSSASECVLFSCIVLSGEAYGEIT